MYVDDSERRKDTYHDFVAEKKWLVIMMGFGDSGSWLYGAYVGLLFGHFIYHIAMNLYGMVILSGDKILILDALHVLMNSVFTVWGLTTRVIANKALVRIREIIKEGFYLYDDDEEELRDQTRMKEKGVDEIRMRSRDFIYIWTVGGLTTMVFYPISQAFLVSRDQYEKQVDLGNPYLPAFFHMPFSTRSTPGLIIAFLIAVVFYVYVVSAAMVMNEIYLSCIMQLRTQLQILNHSIRHIDQRATALYKRTCRPPNEPSADLTQDLHFRRCVHSCLRSNVRHHQVLLKFNDEVLKFSGSFLLLMVNVASITFASHLYIIMQNPSLNLSVKCLIMLLVEQTYTFYLCIFGEIIMRESGRLFESLYSIPWFFYGKKVNLTLRVFMVYSMKPMKVKSLLLDFTASLETYANFLSAMYKIVNILKQSDTI